MLAAQEEKAMPHDGRCRCGAVVPCEEADCAESPGHEYPCPECLAAERRRPADPMLAALESRADGFASEAYDPDPDGDFLR